MLSRSEERQVGAPQRKTNLAPFSTNREASTPPKPIPNSPPFILRSSGALAVESTRHTRYPTSGPPLLPAEREITGPLQFTPQTNNPSLGRNVTPIR